MKTNQPTGIRHGAVSGEQARVPAAREHRVELSSSWRRWIAGTILLLVLAATCLIEAQDDSTPVLTNGLPQVEDATAMDVSQTADAGQEEDLSGTNTVADTNQTVVSGSDGRTRRRYRQAQNRLRRSSQTSNDPRATATTTNSGPSALDYSAFRLVVDRNIFDPNRAPHSRPTAQPKTFDSFTLVGTMSYEKGIFAFFDGSSSDYKKALKPEDSIAGYKVVAITSDSVKLMLNTNLVELNIGTQMRRREDGTWQRSANAETYAASTANSASNSSSEPTTSGAESDIIKKMMQRREKE